MALALSGGKDSYTMLSLMMQLKQALPFDVEFLALHLDQQQPGYDGEPLVSWLREQALPFEILSEDTYSVVTDQLGPQQTYCSLCSRLRRGALYTALGRLGFNKLALGHHRDDTIETFLLNLMYAGKLQAMPAKYTTDDGRYEVIRPLIECAEERIAEFAELMDYPILPCNLCGSQDGLKREQLKRLLAQLEADQPNLKSVMLNALRNVRPTHLLDADLRQAWEQRAPEIRPDPEATSRPQRMAALPLISLRVPERRVSPLPSAE